MPGQAAVRRKVTAAVFALIVLTFFLPWMHLSCADQRVATVTGLQLLTGEPGREFGEAMTMVSGTDIEQPQGGSPVQVLVTMVLLVTIAGAVLVIVIPREKTAFGMAMALGASQVLLLVGLVSAVHSGLADAGPFIQVRYEAGFYLAFGLALAATLSGGYALLGHGSLPVTGETLGAGRSPRAALFCPRCGLPGNPQEAFCTACGTRLHPWGAGPPTSP